MSFLSKDGLERVWAGVKGRFVAVEAEARNAGIIADAAHNEALGLSNQITTLSLKVNTLNAEGIAARSPDTSNLGFDTTVQKILDTVHPVGEIFLTTEPANPAAYFGFGTWVAWGAGRVPVGMNTGDADFDAVEKTGGAKSHTNELTNAGYAKMAVRAAASEQMLFDMVNNVTAYTTGYTLTPGNTLSVASNEVNRGIRLAGVTGNGSSLQPYITCYMWKRTA